MSIKDMEDKAEKTLAEHEADTAAPRTGRKPAAAAPAPAPAREPLLPAQYDNDGWDDQPAQMHS